MYREKTFHQRAFITVVLWCLWSRGTSNQIGFIVNRRACLSFSRRGLLYYRGPKYHPRHLGAALGHYLPGRSSALVGFLNPLRLYNQIKGGLRQSSPTLCHLQSLQAIKLSLDSCSRDFSITAATRGVSCHGVFSSVNSTPRPSQTFLSDVLGMQLELPTKHYHQHFDQDLKHICPPMWFMFHLTSHWPYLNQSRIVWLIFATI